MFWDSNTQQATIFKFRTISLSNINTVSMSHKTQVGPRKMCWDVGYLTMVYIEWYLRGVNSRSLFKISRLEISRRIKVKSLCFNWATCHECILREWKYSSTHSLTSALDGGEWSASRPGRFTPRERAPVNHWIGGWMGPRASLYAVVMRKISSPYRDSKHRQSILWPK
jgi:hypothetical protein